MKHSWLRVWRRFQAATNTAQHFDDLGDISARDRWLDEAEQITARWNSANAEALGILRRITGKTPPELWGGQSL